MRSTKDQKRTLRVLFDKKAILGLNEKLYIKYVAEKKLSKYLIEMASEAQKYNSYLLIYEVLVIFFQITSNTKVLNQIFSSLMNSSFIYILIESIQKINITEYNNALSKFLCYAVIETMNQVNEEKKIKYLYDLIYSGFTFLCNKDANTINNYILIFSSFIKNYNDNEYLINLCHSISLDLLENINVIYDKIKNHLDCSYLAFSYIRLVRKALNIVFDEKKLTKKQSKNKKDNILNEKDNSFMVNLEKSKKNIIVIFY